MKRVSPVTPCDPILLLFSLQSQLDVVLAMCPWRFPLGVDVEEAACEALGGWWEA